ncbi:MAG: hypothetical protein ACI8W8_001873 [Rhodothermales bacterium]|jgi:hypothetical protein
MMADDTYIFVTADQGLCCDHRGLGKQNVFDYSVPLPWRQTRTLAPVRALLIILGCLLAGCKPPGPPPSSIAEPARLGYTDAIQDFLAKGADPNAKDGSGTPLIVLTMGPNGENSAARALLDAGANVDGTGPGGRTALMEACNWVAPGRSASAS